MTYQSNLTQYKCTSFPLGIEIGSTAMLQQVAEMSYLKHLVIIQHPSQLPRDAVVYICGMNGLMAFNHRIMTVYMENVYGNVIYVYKAIFWPASLNSTL